MATIIEPNNKTPETDNPGQQEYEQLVRQTTPSSNSTAPGRISYNSGDIKTERPSTQSNSTSPGITTYDSSPEISPSEQSFYKSNSTKSDGKKTKVRLGSFFGSRRYQVIVGGGATATIAGLLIFFISSGPLEFVHIAQLLEQFHFSAQQDQSDDRLTKLTRFAKYSSSGQLEKTRLGAAGNFIADKVEAKMNAVGIESSYKGLYHWQNGYVIDPAKLSTSEFADLKGKTSAEIQQYFKDNFGVDVSFTDPSTNKPFTDDRFFLDNSKVKMGLFNTNGRAFIKTMLRSSGYSKITSATTFRIMAKRGGIPLHPISIAEGKGLTKAAELAQWAKDRFQSTEEGATPTPESAQNGVDPKKDPAGAAQAQTATDSANSTITDGQSAYTKLKNGATDAFAQAKAGLNTKLGAGGLTATGVLCTLQAVDSNSRQIEEAQVVLPLAREGAEAMSLGGQVMAGQDLDTTHLGFFKKLLNGLDHTGKFSSWIQARSIQAQLGHANSGALPPKTLTTINKSSPFHFLNTDPGFSIPLAGACSLPGTIAQIAIGFLGGGGITSKVAQLAFQTIVGGQLLDDAAHWIAGAAVDPTAAGADYGSAFDYGAHLAANGQAVSQGGRKLSDSESTTLLAFENNQAQQDFQSHGLAYKLLNPYDYRSAVSKIIDNTNPNPGQDIAKMGTMFINFGHLFASLPKLFTASALAAPVPYDYGFPEYGFSADEMNNPAVENPYANADYVVKSILPAHPEYIGWVKDCFGATIDPTTYDITDFGTSAIDPTNPDPTKQNFYTDQSNGCDTSVAYNPHAIQTAATSGTSATGDCTNSTTDACYKLRIRFYLNDTENGTGVQCGTGDPSDPNTQDACQAVGLDNQNSSSGGSTTVSGGWAWPTKVQGSSITSCYGNRNGAAGGGKHPGTDIAQADGTPVYAAQSGKVTYVGPVGGYGDHYVAIEVSPTVNEGYGHMGSARVTVGQQVTAGQQIGTVDNEGESHGNHLHFNLRIGPNTDPYNGNASPFNHGLKVPAGVPDPYNCANYHYPGSP